MNEERTPRLVGPRRDSGQEQVGDHATAVSVEQLLVVGDLPLRSIAISSTLGHLAEVGLIRRSDHYTLDEKADVDLVNWMHAHDIDPRLCHGAEYFPVSRPAATALVFRCID